MKKAAFSMAALMVLSAAAYSQTGGPTTASRPADALEGEYAEMAIVCKLTDGQLAKLKEKVAAGKDASAAYWKENLEKVKQLSKEQLEAVSAKDTEKVKKLQGEIQAYYDKSRQLYAQSRLAAMDVLTPEQRLAWDSDGLQKDASARYRRIDLTEDQQKKAKQFCDEAAADVGKIKDPTDYAARGVIRDGVFKKIDELLTPEQKDLLPKYPSTKPAIEK